MHKRLIATVLWAVAVLLMYELAWSVGAVPREIGPALALGAAVFVGLDPLRLFWSPVVWARPSREARDTSARLGPLPSAR